jgi:hypothetical protein
MSSAHTTHCRATPQPRLLMAAIIAALLLGLAGCGGLSATPTPEPAEASGVNNPEPVVESFFEDLGKALNDPQLANDERRSYWVEQLAGYFAPGERDDQRLALREALGSFAGDLSRLEDGEVLKIEMRGFRDSRKSLSADGTRATVELPDATISMLITQASDKGPITIYEQPIALSRIIGNATNSVPLVRIGGRWYLTEG